MIVEKVSQKHKITPQDRLKTLAVFTQGLYHPILILDNMIGRNIIDVYNTEVALVKRLRHNYNDNIQ